MKKGILITILIFIYNSTFAQIDTTFSRIPEIELPDFVITGQAKVDVPQFDKASAPLISPLSKEFILPKIKVQELSLEGLSDPTKQQPSIIDTSKKYFGRSRLGFSIYSMPDFEFFYSSYLDKFNFSLGSNFENSRSYEPNSKYLIGDAFIRGSYIIKKEGQPPARLNLASNLKYHNYSNFKSNSPDLFNKNIVFSLSGNVENLLYREFNLTLGGRSNFQKLTRWDYSFFELNAYGTLRSTFEHFELSATAEPMLYKISRDTTINKLILSASGELYFRKLFNAISIITRLDYQSENENGGQFLAPSVRVGFGLSNFWNLTLFYENKLYNRTPIDLWNINPYLDSLSFNYSIERVKNRIGLGNVIYFDQASNLRFEVSYYNVKGKNVFIYDTSNPGFFDFSKFETAVFELNTDLYINFKKYGDYFLNIRYLNSKLKQTTREEPHTPPLYIKTSYVYYFKFPLSLRLSFLYYSNSYGDINRILEVGSYSNLEVGFEYQVWNFMKVGLELKNILNKENFRWYNYNEKPFDILLFIKTRF